MANLKNFIFNSDYPTDKILFAQKGSVKVTGFINYAYISTDIPVQLFVEGDYKIEGNPETYPILTYGGPLFTGIYSAVRNGKCDILIVIYDLRSQYTNKTIDFKVWGVAKDEDTKNIELRGNANQMASKFVLNTDNTYPRFMSDGVAAVGDIITHNSGYIPTIKYWRKENTEWPDQPGVRVDSYLASSRGWIGPNVSGFSQADQIQLSDVWLKFVKLEDGSNYQYYYRLYAQ